MGHHHELLLLLWNIPQATSSTEVNHQGRRSSNFNIRPPTATNERELIKLLFLWDEPETPKLKGNEGYITEESMPMQATQGKANSPNTAITPPEAN